MVIILEVAPPDTGTVRVAKVGAGRARISTDEISLQLEDELRNMPQINQVNATVLARASKAEIRLDLHVASEADLTATSDEACRRARELVEGRMGVELAGAPQAQLHYRELRVTRPSAPPAAPGRPSTQTMADPAPAAPTPPASPNPSVSLPTTEPRVTHEASETAQQDRPAAT